LLAKQLFFREKALRVGLSFYRIGWIDETFLHVQLRWTWQPPKAALLVSLAHLQEVSWAPDPRYCPLCLQGRYPNHFESHQLLWDSIEGSTKCGGVGTGSP